MKLSEKQMSVVLAALKMYRMDLYLELRDARNIEEAQLIEDLIVSTVDLSFRFQSASDIISQVNYLKSIG
jgi:hypothetical protein